MIPDLVEMGVRIAKRRKALHIDQRVLAERLGVSNNHLSNIERGKSIPGMQLFMKLCLELDVNPDYLLQGNLQSNNVPQTIVDDLHLCSEKDLAFVAAMVKFLIIYKESNP